MMRKNGFTLAEVLITLGIIGVVAAMTIPTLISNTNGAQFKTAYKKVLSTMNQAVLMNIALENTDLSTLKKDAATGQTVPDGATMTKLLNDRMQSATDITTNYFKEATDIGSIEYTGEVACTTENKTQPDSPCYNSTNASETGAATTFTPTNTNVKIFSFADGTSFAYNINAENCTDSTKGSENNKCIGFIDVNGATGPNRVVTCTSGKEGGTGADATNGACQVDSSGVTDIYPVYLHGQTVEPASDAARAVLFGK